MDLYDPKLLLRNGNLAIGPVAVLDKATIDEFITSLMDQRGALM